MIDIKNTGIQFNPDDPHFKEAISSVPRLLSLIDRNPVSKSFGSFDRSYWLEKSIDFPSANLQFGVLALSLLYKIVTDNWAWAGHGLFYNSVIFWALLVAIIPQCVWY